MKFVCRWRGIWDMGSSGDVESWNNYCRITRTEHRNKFGNEADKIELLKLVAVVNILEGILV